MKTLSEDIIRAAARGDVKAFEEIYKAFSGFVYAVTLRMLHNATEAQDVTQEVFIRVYDHLKKFEFRSSLKTWIFRITINCSITALKKYRNEKTRCINLETVLPVLPAQENHDTVLHDEGREEIVKNLLSRLPAEQRACLILREIQGLRYDEIARTLNININTVRSRLKRGRESLMALSKAQKEVIKNEL